MSKIMWRSIIGLFLSWYDVIAEDREEIYTPYFFVSIVFSVIAIVAGYNLVIEDGILWAGIPLVVGGVVGALLAIITMIALLCGLPYRDGTYKTNPYS